MKLIELHLKKSAVWPLDKEKILKYEPVFLIFTVREGSEGIA